MLGAWKVGAVVVNVNVQWTAEQLSYVAADCGVRAMIVGRAALRRRAMMTACHPCMTRGRSRFPPATARKPGRTTPGLP